MQNQHTVDMTQGVPLRQILSFALPLMLGNLFQQLYNVVDTAIVGRLVGADALAAVGCTGTVTFFFFTLVSGLCVGAGVVVAQYWAARRYAELKALLATFGVMVLGFGAVLAVLGVTLAPWALRLLQVPAALLGDATAYMRICVGLIFGSVGYNAASTVLRSMGDSRTPLLAMAVSSITNILLDLTFILQFGLGVRGAAIATVISQFVSAGICLARLARCRAPFDFAALFAHPPRPDAAMARLLFKMGLPSALQSSMISLGGMSVQGLVNTFGPVVMAAYTTVLRIDSLTIQVVVAISSALAVYTGQNIGAKNIPRVKQGLRQTLAAMTGLCLLLAVTVFTFRRGLMELFLDPVTSGESIALGCQYLTVIGFAYMIAGVMNSYLNVIRGAGDVNVSVLAGLFELGARVLFAFLLSRFLGVWGIWLATPLSWGCGCIIPVWRYYSREWMKKAL